MEQRARLVDHGKQRVRIRVERPKTHDFFCHINHPCVLEPAEPAEKLRTSFAEVARDVLISCPFKCPGISLWQTRHVAGNTCSEVYYKVQVQERARVLLLHCKTHRTCPLSLCARLPLSSGHFRHVYRLLCHACCAPFSVPRAFIPANQRTCIVDCSCSVPCVRCAMCDVRSVRCMWVNEEKRQNNSRQGSPASIHLSVSALSARSSLRRRYNSEGHTFVTRTLPLP